jgi:iron complex transport system ATP-binding protein
MTLSTRGLAQSVPGRILFEGLDFEAGAGTINVVVGPNGSGKSTLLRRLAGLEQPDAGEVQLDGAPLDSIAPKDRARRIGYLPQSTPLYHDLRVDELVMLGRAPHLGRFGAPAKEDHQAVDNALLRVGAQDLRLRGLFSLSGGERQRVMLARMLATGAPILVLDEPTTALDVGHALAFLELCKELADGGSTLILALHDLERAKTYGQHAICLGRPKGAVDVGPVTEVLSPANLAEVFGVEVVEETRLTFRPRS